MPSAYDEVPFRDVAPDAAATLGPRPVHRIPMLGDPSPFGRSLPRAPFGTLRSPYESTSPRNSAFGFGAPGFGVPMRAETPAPPPGGVGWATIHAQPPSPSYNDRRLLELEEKMTQTQNRVSATDARLAAVEEQLRALSARLDALDHDTAAHHALARAMKDDTEAMLRELQTTRE